MLKDVTKWVVFAYALLIIALGLIAYVNAGSVVSAIAGGSIGTLLLISALFLFMNKKAGFFAALFLTALLTGIVAYRFTITNALTPAVIAVISAAMLIYLLIQSKHWVK
jgi:uncharacterized membrane protein (UPF0136 family)